MKKTTLISKKLLLAATLGVFALGGFGILASYPRLVQAEAENPYVGDRGSGQEKMEATEKKIEDQNAQQTAEERSQKKTEKALEQAETEAAKVKQ